MSEKLPPCPFCAASVTSEYRLGRTWVDHPRSKNCPLSGFCFSPEEWSTRPSAALTDEEKGAVEALTSYAFRCLNALQTRQSCPKDCSLCCALQAEGEKLFPKMPKDIGHKITDLNAACVRRLSTLPEAGRECRCGAPAFPGVIHRSDAPCVADPCWKAKR